MRRYSQSFNDNSIPTIFATFAASSLRDLFDVNVEALSPN